MLTVALSSATAMLFGVADFLGGVASRRAPAAAVTALAHCVGLVLFSVALLVVPVPFSRTAVLAGASAGVAGGVGVAALYGALARGRMSVVAPITAALSGSLAAVYDFLGGARITWLGATGLVCALVATVIVSSTAADDGSGEGAASRALPPLALLLSVVAGVGFAGSFISFSLAGSGSGFWPLASARLVSVVLVGAFALVRGRGKAGVPPETLRVALGAGMLDAAANVTMLSAIRLGPLAVAAVIGSLYPVGTVLLARFVLHERLHPWQRIGIALALVSVVLAALP